MSVLPQLQQELAVAHARRLGRGRVRSARTPFAGRVAVAVGAVLAVAVAAAAVVLVRSGPRAVMPASGSIVLFRGPLDDPYAADGSLYGVSPSYPPSDLIRIDPSTGRIVARVVLAPPSEVVAGSTERPDPQAGQELLAGGSLWVTGTAPPQTWLWRLDPRSLAVRSLTLLPGAGYGGTGSLAAAGGWLWAMNGDTLDRVSLTTGRDARSEGSSEAIGGHGDTVAADHFGRILLITIGGNATNGIAGSAVLRLDPRSGVVIAMSSRFSGYSPAIAGIIDGGVWVNGLTNVGGPERLDLRTLEPTARYGTVHDFAHVFDGILWNGDHAAENSCLDPLTGRLRMRLPTIVAADGASLYFLRSSGGYQIVSRMTLPGGCR